MKLCIDCKHYKSRSCNHPSTGISLVDGDIKGEYASVMRLDQSPCKEEALLFEPMEAVIYDLRDIFPEVPFPNLKGATQ